MNIYLLTSFFGLPTATHEAIDSTLKEYEKRPKEQSLSTLSFVFSFPSVAKKRVGNTCGSTREALEKVVASPEPRTLSFRESLMAHVTAGYSGDLAGPHHKTPVGF